MERGLDVNHPLTRGLLYDGRFDLDRELGRS
jgi:hypothetical protein